MSSMVTVTLIFFTAQEISFIRKGCLFCMATDPVCFSIADEDTAQFRTTFRDREYYFCTDYCKKQYLSNPERYTRFNADISIEPGRASC